MALRLAQEFSRQAHQTVRETPSQLKFEVSDGFYAELRRRVDHYFRGTGRRPRDCPQMYWKTLFIFGWFAASYALLVFLVGTWWLALPLAISLGLSMAAVGFNIQHDGGHQAYSKRTWVNKLAAFSLDLIGASSYLWHWKHGVLHHTFVNITGHDTDIDLSPLGRLTPHQKRLWFHRWQHFYAWVLYGFLTIKWQLYDDLKDALVGHMRGHRVPRPRGWDLAVFVGGKLLFYTLAFVIPMLLHPVWAVLLWFGVASLVLGLVMATVFQLAHVVPEADFPLPEPGTGHMENSWAVHQAETTVDFARKYPLVSWFLGGLNFQIEHHLFPRICHVNYPALSKVVEATCREYGVKYSEHPTVRAGVVAHFRWLRRMGEPDV